MWSRPGQQRPGRVGSEVRRGQRFGEQVLNVLHGSIFTRGANDDVLLRTAHPVHFHRIELRAVAAQEPK